MSDSPSRLRELKGALSEKLNENEQIVDSLKEQDGTPIIEGKHFKAFQANLADSREIRAEIEALEGHNELKTWAEAPASSPSFAGSDLRNVDTRSLGERFADSEEFKSLDGGRSGYTMRTPYQVAGDLGSLWQSKDAYTALPSGTPGSFGTITRDPMVDRAHRRVRVRDLFPIRSTTSNVIEYFRVSGFTNNASVVPERTSNNSTFAAKPQSTLAFVGEQATVRTIAHYEAAHRNVLADEPQLAGIINDELLYGLRLHEDYQILSGAGTSEDLLGILNVSGIQTHSQGAGGDTKADAIRRSITKSLLAFYEPTGVVIHPNDWEDIELSKDDNKNYIVATSVAIGGEPRVFRLPLVDTPAIDEGTALVGAFGLGAQLYDREQGNIRIAEQHSDFFIRNAVVILAEERLALAVKRPEAFVELTFE